MRRHIVWDMGGTLVDTYPQLDATLAGVARAAGTEVTDAEVAALTRVSTGVAIRELAARSGLPEGDFEEANAALKERWRTDPAPVADGARDVMAAVRALGGLNLVVTHRDRRSATALLDGLGLRVDDMVCAPDGFPRKPAPDMHREILRRHGLPPAECLGVGDRPIDAEAALAAGIDAVLLVGPDIAPAPPGPSGAPTVDPRARRVTRLGEVVDLLG